MCNIVFFKQKTAYYMLIRNWSTDVCASDLLVQPGICGLRLGREELLDRPVCCRNVRRVAGERGPPERPLALAEERADVGRHEPGELEGPVIAALASLDRKGTRLNSSH